MSDIDDLMTLYKEIQENYIKALERENAELREQREKDSLKIEELEKKLEEGNKRYFPSPNNIPYDKVIGPGTGVGGWGYPNQYPQIGTNNPITWTSNKIGTLSDGQSTPTNYISSSNEIDTIKEAKKAFETLRDAVKVYKASSTAGKLSDENNSYVDKMKEYLNHIKDNKNDD